MRAVRRECALGSVWDVEVGRYLRTHLVTSREIRSIAEGETRVFAKPMHKRRLNPEK